MDLTEAFTVWVPTLPEDDHGPPWTFWAKPVLFAAAFADVPLDSLADVPWSAQPVMPNVDHDSCAVVVDLPGRHAISVGIDLAERGFRPVPLFNGCPGVNELVNTRELVLGLRVGAARLQRLTLPADAPPAFLLDARRMSREVPPQPGRFDNRWFTFPQDFPSANLLRARGVRSALLVQEQSGQPSEDLAHVLRRWQEAGIEIRLATPEATRAESLTVQTPRRFRSVWYGLLAMMGLFPNSAGGFGGTIPQPASGTG